MVFDFGQEHFESVQRRMQVRSNFKFVHNVLYLDCSGKYGAPDTESVLFGEASSSFVGLYVLSIGWGLDCPESSSSGITGAGVTYHATTVVPRMTRF